MVRDAGSLKVYNRIYFSVFNLSWVQKELGNLRPYAEAISAWLASNCSEESWLLRGQALRDARAWAANKSLSHQDYQFLSDSQELEQREVRNALEVEKAEARVGAEAARAKEASRFSQ